MKWFWSLVVIAVAGFVLRKHFANQPAPPHRNLATDGTFFLVQRATITTDKGIYGLAPGTKVKRVKEDGENLIVSDGRQEFQVAARYLTNDLDAAARISQLDRINQRRIGEAIDKDVAKHTAQVEAELLAEDQRNSTRARRTSQLGSAPSALNRGAYDQKYGVAKPAEFYGTPNVYRDLQGRTYWVDDYGNAHRYR